MKKFITSLMIVFTVCIRLYAIELTSVEAELLVEKDFKDLTFEQWDSKIKYRGVDYKQPEQLVELRKCYERKIPALQEMLLTEKDAEQITFLNTKIARLKDKYTSVLKEIEFREKKLIERELHHTAYYCDYTNGNDSNDGLSADNDHSWKTIAKYTNVTARTTGDILYVRANQTHNYSAAGAIAFDEDGDGDTWLKIIGCDAVANDPWSDTSDVKPIIDFGDGSNYLAISGDAYWWIERLNIQQGGYTSGQIMINGGSTTLGFLKLVSCDISDGAASNIEGIALTVSAKLIMESCTMIDCYGTTIINTGGVLEAYNCDFDGGVVRGSAYCLTSQGGLNYFYNCSFGDTSQFSSAIVKRYGGSIYMRNCSWSGTLDNESESNVGELFIEDDDNVYEVHSYYSRAGTIERSVAVTRSGGADSSAYMTPNANCGLILPLVLGDTMSGFAKVWLTKDVEVNISVYACVASAWDSALGATEAYARFSYLSNGATAARTEVDSTEQISNVAETWTAFTSGAFTPLQTGFVYIWFYLAEYEDASEHIYVDIKPVVN